MYCMSFLHVCTFMHFAHLQYMWAKCMAVCHTLVDVCVCMSYSQGSDDKPGGGTQVFIAVHI